MKVIVVGGGIAGLAAVHALRVAGAEVVCFESTGVPGGRVITARHDGFIMDFGAQFFFQSYDTCFRLAKEIGLANELTTWVFKVGILNKGRFLPVVASINPRDMLSNLGEMVRFVVKGGIPFHAMLQLLGILPTLIKRYKDFNMIAFEQALDLDHESLADFVLRKGGKTVLDYFMHAVAECLTLAKAEDISAMYGLGLLWNMINGLFTFQHGLGSIAERMGEKYAGCIQYNSPVERIVIEHGKVKGVEVNGALMEADAVIPAITATKLLKITPGLPESIRKPLERVTYSACCHVIFALPEPLMPKDWYALIPTRLSNSVVSGFTDSSVKSKYYSPTGCSQISCWTYDRYAHAFNDLPEAEIKQVLIKEIQRFVPCMPDPLFTEIYRWREAVCIGQPGMLSGIARLKRENYRDIKGLCLAGEYLYMPSVESAARSGMDAAKAALQ